MPRVFLLALVFFGWVPFLRADFAITRQPDDLFLPYGGQITLYVAFDGPANSAYVWKKNGVPITLEPGYGYYGILSNVKPADSGSYTITFTGSFGSVTSRAATVTVSEAIPPRILGLPGPATVVRGLSFNVHPSIIGTAPMAYDWFKDGVLIPGEHGADFDLSPVSASHGGSYTVRATNLAGTVTSAPYVLTVLNSAPAVIVDNPRSFNALPGEQIYLNLGITGVYADYTFTILKDGIPVTGSTTHPATAADIGDYQYLVTNEAGSVRSETAHINVGPQGTFYIRQQPASMKRDGVYSYGNFLLDVVYPKGAEIYAQWYKDGQPIDSSRQFLTPLIGAVAYEDTGSYYAEIQLLDFQRRPTGQKLTTDTVRLDFITPRVGPIIKGSLASPDVKTGATVTWEPVVSSLDPDSLAYVWRKNGLPLPGATARKLTLVHVTMADSAVYDLLITDSAGRCASNLATLQVRLPDPANPLGPPQAILSQTQSQTVARGATLNLVIFPDPFPATPEWRKDGLLIDFYPTINSATKQLGYSIPNFGDADVGTYTCAVTSGSGTAVSAPIVLSLPDRPPPPAGPPVISVQPSSQQVAFGSNVNFTVGATGGAPLHYQWRRNGAYIAGATGATIDLRQVDASVAGAYDVLVTNALGTVKSSAATLVVPTAVAISIGSVNVSRIASVGDAMALTAPATSGATYYQWRRNGINLSGANSATLTMASLDDSAFGLYSVLVTSPAGNVVSPGVSLSRSDAPAAAPRIVRQPEGTALKIGGTLALNVGATGSPEPAYQWRRNGVALPNATAATLIIENAPGGDYAVDVSNVNGSVTSSPATISLTTGFGRQTNVSTRSFVGTGENILINGFVVGGPTPKRLLIRSVGPTLAGYGVDGVLADPMLGLYDSAAQLIQANDNWGSDPTGAALVRSSASSAGAFSLPEGSKDAAIVVTLAPGRYSIKTTGVGNTTGIALAEAYDLDVNAETNSRLVNVSTRNFAGTGPAALITGFVVEGSVAKTILVRAVGPALQAYGVGGVLAQPQLTVYDQLNHVMGSNVGWESAGVSDAIIAATARVGGFALPRGSRDGCLMLLLKPGVYSAVITGTGSASGVALAEVYEVP